MATGRMKQSLEKILHSGVKVALGASLLLNASCLYMPEEDPYGCVSKNSFKQQSDGSYEGKVDGRFYLHPTGIFVKSGDSIEISTTGEVCWYGETCSGPDGIQDVTWGLYAGYLEQGKDLKSQTYNTLDVKAGLIGLDYKAAPELPDSTKMYELILVIPDGSSTSYCLEGYYVDNSKEFQTNVKVNGPS